MKKQILILSLFFLTVPGCDFIQSLFTKETEKTVLQVGQFKITEQMVKDRDAFIRVSYPGETRSLGLHQLKSAYISAQILENNGHKVDDYVLAKEEVRIDKATLAPEKLQEIKDIFGSRKEDYRRTFILPVYAQRIIYYDFFLNNNKVQAESLAQAEEFYRSMSKDPKKWTQKTKELEKEKKVYTSKATVSLGEGFQWVREEDPLTAGAGAEGGGKLIDQSKKTNEQIEMEKKFKQQQEQQVSKAGQKWVNELIKPIKPGQVVQKVINQGEAGWLVVRYTQPTKNLKNSYDLDVVIFPKRDYQSWLEEETSKIQIK